MERHCDRSSLKDGQFRTWYLREEKPPGEFDPKKNPNPAHEDVQGMLLELGKIYGYETSAAINDAKKKFMNIQRYKRDLQGKNL
jgi:hypothetical protein